MGAEEGPRGGTPGGLKHMAVVDNGSSQKFEVVRIIIFLSGTVQNFGTILILVVKANFSITYLLHAERRYLVYEIKFRNNFKCMEINVIHK